MSIQIKQGQSSSGTVLFNWDVKLIRQGQSSGGTVLSHIDSNLLRQGQSSGGTVIYNFTGSIPVKIVAAISMGLI